MPDWPNAAGFPQVPLAGTWRRLRQKNALEFAPDVGPPLVRKRSTVSTLSATFNIKLTEAQLATLDTFFETTCGEGSVQFDWTNPETGVTDTWAWANPPEVINETKNAYIVTCQLRRDS